MPVQCCHDTVFAPPWETWFRGISDHGRYYCDHQIPVARTIADKKAMLDKHLPNTMIEVLIHGDVALPEETIVYCYADPDALIARRVLTSTRCPWTIRLAARPASIRS